MKKLFLTLVAVLMLSLPAVFVPSAAAFDFFHTPTQPACTGSNDSPVCKQTPNQQKNPVLDVIHATTNDFALIAGVLAVIMIIVSGFTMVTSGGNQEAVTNSRKRIVNAIVGLVIVALAWVIIRFVTDIFIK